MLPLVASGVTPAPRETPPTPGSCPAVIAVRAIFPYLRSESGRADDARDGDVVGTDKTAAVDVKSATSVRELGLKPQGFRLNDLLGERQRERVARLDDPAAIGRVVLD